MSYMLGKSLHIVGFISWFAGLFYIVRLFVYHAEAGERPEPDRSILQVQLELMAARLWKIITVPAIPRSP
jgi:putative membrane protein